MLATDYTNPDTFHNWVAAILGFLYIGIFLAGLIWALIKPKE